MNIWRINKIPTIEPLSDKAVEFNKRMKNLLLSFQSGAETEKSSIEILFVHGSGKEIRIYLIIRGFGNENTEKLIEKSLDYSGCLYSVLFEKECSDLFTELSDFSENSFSAIRKAEFISQTQPTFYTPAGYHYWADNIEYNVEEDGSNLNMLFQTLSVCEKSFVSFQLMPLSFKRGEMQTYESLSEYLLPIVSQPSVNNSSVDLYANRAYKAYNGIYSYSGQPFFSYNIVVGASMQNREVISKQIVSFLKNQAVNSPEFNVISTGQMDFSLEDFPYSLNMFLLKNYRLNIWHIKKSQIQLYRTTAPIPLFRMPIIVNIDEALSFFRLPYNDKLIPGVVGTYFNQSNEALSDEVTSDDNILFGKMFGGSSETVGADLNSFAKHTLIVGMPGTGKTTFAINLLLQFAEKGIPFLAIEPTKTEYRSMIDEIEDLQIFTPGNNGVSPLILNPFMPPEGVRIESYKPSLISAFEASIGGFSESPLNDIFIEAINKCYEAYGWRDSSILGDKGTVAFGIHEFISVFRDVMSDKDNYNGETRGNILEAGITRLRTLINQNPNIFDTDKNIPVSDLISKPTVIELNAINNTEQKSLIISLLLIRITSYVNSGLLEGSGLKSVIMLDEAHVFLNSSGTRAQEKAASMIYSMIAECRAQGVGLIIADQRPTVVGQAIRANTDIKITFRLVEKAEKEAILSGANFDELADKQLSNLKIGEAYVFYYKLDQPVLIKAPETHNEKSIRKHIEDDDIKDSNKYWLQNPQYLKPYGICAFCKNDNGTCNVKMRADAKYVSNIFWSRTKHMIRNDVIEGEEYSQTDIFEKLVKILPSKAIGDIVADYAENKDEFFTCAKIALIRKAQLEKSIYLSKEKTIQLLK